MSLKNPGDAPVKLAPPGAGLPAPELWISRALFFVARQTTSQADGLRRFQDEAYRILAVVENIEPISAQRPVLIPRLAGMEDSSRQ